MKILVVGGGGREHAIIMKLAESKQVDALYCAPGNGGIAQYATCYPVKATDIEGMVQLAKQLAKGRKVAVYPVSENEWLDMGQLEELERMRGKLYGE